MKLASTLTTVAVLAATLGTAAAAHTTVITRANTPHSYTIMRPQPAHLHLPVLYPEPLRHLHPRPLPFPGPACLSCPPTPVYDAPYLMMPRVILR